VQLNSKDAQFSGQLVWLRIARRAIRKGKIMMHVTASFDNIRSSTCKTSY